MRTDSIIEILAFIFIIGVPVLALTTRFVLQPLIRDIVAAIRGVGERNEDDFEHRLSRVEESLLEESRRVDRLAEAEAFRRRLESGMLEAPEAKSVEVGPEARSQASA